MRRLLPSLALLAFRRFDEAGVRRLDRSTHVPLGKPTKQPNGSLVGEMIIAHTGVQAYVHADDPAFISPGAERLELIDDATLSDPEWLASLEGAPITVRHVRDANPKNMKRVRVGTILGARFENGNNIARYVLDTEAAFAAVQSGLKSVSVGYDLVLDSTAGSHTEYGRFDARQRHRRANHVALVERGRAPKARGRFDSRRKPMDPLRLALALGLVGYNLGDVSDDITPTDFANRLDEAAKSKAAPNADEVRADLVKATATIASKDEEIEKLKADLAKAKGGDSEASKKAADEAASTARGDSATFLEAHSYRGRLLSLADGLDIEKVDELGNGDLAKAIVSKRVDAAPEDPSTDYLRATIDHLEALSDSKNSRLDGLKTATGENRSGAGKSRVDSSPETVRSGFTAGTMAAINMSA